ncbi:transposase, partial [Pseudomonas spirodelae]
MSSYSPERKAALIRKLLPPQNMSVAELSRQEGISQATLYAWRTKLKAGGAVVPGDKNNADDWPAEAKFA